jgi:hypothetical protein
MANFRVAETTSTTVLTVRELTLAADAALWAGDQDDCIAIVSQLYGLFDGLDAGTSSDPLNYLIAANTAALIGGQTRRAQLLSHALASC